MDCWFEDVDNTKTKSDYYLSNTSNVNITNVDNYKLVESSLNNNIVRVATPNFISGDFEFIVEVKTPSTNTVSPIVFDSNNKNLYIGMSVGSDWSYVRFKRVGSNITVQISTDGVNWTNKTPSSSLTDTTVDLRCGFSFGYNVNSPTFQFRNIKVYPI